MSIIEQMKRSGGRIYAIKCEYLSAMQPTLTRTSWLHRFKRGWVEICVPRDADPQFHAMCEELQLKWYTVN